VEVSPSKGFFEESFDLMIISKGFGWREKGERMLDMVRYSVGRCKLVVHEALAWLIRDHAIM
jgi:hypothetical protein